MMSKKILFLFTILSSLVYKSSAIYCFYCSSPNNSACLDPKQYDEETRSRLIPIVNCNTAISNVPENGFFCRKIEQIIFHPHRDNDIRVTRGCGWVRNHNPTNCYRADSKTHLETVCQCFSDHCNSATINSACIISVVLGLSLYFYY